MICILFAHIANIEAPAGGVRDQRAFAVGASALAGLLVTAKVAEIRFGTTTSTAPAESS
jgi:hypothetical protein